MVENITTELLIQTWDPGTDGIYGNHPSLMNFWYFLIFGVFFNPDQEFWAILSWFLGHFCSAFFSGNSREARWGGALASWIQWLQVCPRPKNPEFHKVKRDCRVCKAEFWPFFPADKTCVCKGEVWNLLSKITVPCSTAGRHFLSSTQSWKEPVQKTEIFLVLRLFSVDSASRIPETSSRRYDNPQPSKTLHFTCGIAKLQLFQLFFFGSSWDDMH